MSSSPYFDRVLDKVQLQRLLSSQGARLIPGRGKPKVQVVYGLDGGGEALVEHGASGGYRVRLYRGKCAC